MKVEENLTHLQVSSFQEAGVRQESEKKVKQEASDKTEREPGKKSKQALEASGTKAIIYDVGQFIHKWQSF